MGVSESERASDCGMIIEHCAHRALRVCERECVCVRENLERVARECLTLQTFGLIVLRGFCCARGAPKSHLFRGVEARGLATCTIRSLLACIKSVLALYALHYTFYITS